MFKTATRFFAATLALAFSAGVATAAPVVIGGKNFTEQQLMAAMTAKLLQAKGYAVDVKAGMGSSVLRQAQENGQIDLYWEYTGTSLITYNKVTERMDPEATYRKVKELDAAKGLVWLNPSKANNTYGLAMNRAAADAKGIKTVSDLARAIKGGTQMTLACNAEWYGRADGLKPFQEMYGFEFPRADVKRMDTGLTYQALKEKQVDVSLVFATDGRIPAFNFVVLKDDKGFFPNYALTPVIRKATLDANPKLAELLNGLSAKLDDSTMARLNARIDVDKKSIEETAADFLKTAGLL